MIATRIETKFNEEFVNLTSRLEIYENDSYSMSVYFQLFNDAKKLFVRVTVALPTPDGEFKSIIVSTTQDICRYIKNANNNPFLKLFFNGHFGSKKIPTNCPIKADNYFIEDFRLYDNILKMRLSETKFMVVIDFCESDMISTGNATDCSATLTIYGEIRETMKKSLRMITSSL